MTAVTNSGDLRAIWLYSPTTAPAFVEHERFRVARRASWRELKAAFPPNHDTVRWYSPSSATPEAGRQTSTTHHQAPITSGSTSARTYALDHLSSVNLPRARSSPSPPASRNATGRADSLRRPTARRRPGSSSLAQRPTVVQQGWSTSYQAGSSGSDSDAVSSDDTDVELDVNRGRTESQHALGNGWGRSGRAHAEASGKPPNRQARDSSPSHSGNSRRNSPTRAPDRLPFTRSRSPAVHLLGNGFSLPGRPASPAFGSRPRQSPPMRYRTFLPATINLTFPIPLSKTRWMVSIDMRQAAENLLLLSSLGYCADKIRAAAGDPFSPDMWISIELSLLIIASTIYYCTTRLAWSKVITPAPADATVSGRPGSPRAMETRRGTPVVTASLNKKEERGLLWMTVPKNYRDSADDGILTGLLGGPFIAAAMLYLSMRSAADPATNRLPPEWLIESPKVLAGSALDAAHALYVSRRNLVSLSTFCSTILIVHVCASRVTEARHRRKVQVPAGELNHVPRKESRRTYLYALFTISVTLWILCVKIMLTEFAMLGIWKNLTNMEVVAASIFFQFSLYSAVRLAHHGFTLGELGLVSFGATALFMEMMNLTLALIWPSQTAFIKTYRLPTPLLVYQLALIPGSLLIGFLLSPLLYLSRHIARRPVRRLRFPEEKAKHRRLLALGFYAGTVLIVGGLIGMWARWCLGNRDPWVWVLFWLVDGRRKWARPALLAYWAALGSLSVAGWNRQLARNRRYRHRLVGSTPPDASIAAAAAASVAAAAGEGRAHGGVQGAGQMSSDPSIPPSPSAETGPLGLSFPNLPNLPNLPQFPNGAAVATDLLDAADKHVPTLTLNARRKFFHALAVVMFVPGVAVDPAFAHLSFSAAFALFTFAEYVRYFALYPFGAAVHVFMNEFLDAKDSGTAILSHFYLLTGCANSVWFESTSKLLHFTGILTLGVGDALASIVGKRLGRHRWCSSTPKTIEGSAAFALSVVACACLLRVCGITEDFSILRYGAVATLASVLEAFSVQNDNLTLPLYMWSMLAIVDA